MLWGIVNSALWTAEFLGWEVVSAVSYTVTSASSFLDFFVSFVMHGVLPTILQILDLTSQAMVVAANATFTVVSVVFEVTSNILVAVLTFIAQVSPKVVEILLLILEFLSNISVLLVKSVTQSALFFYEGFTSFNWAFIFHQVGDVLSKLSQVILSCSILLYSMAESLVSGLFTHLIHLITGTWYTMNCVITGIWYAVTCIIDGIVVSVVGVYRIILLIFKMLFSSPVTFQNNLAHLGVNKTITLGIILCVMVYACFHYKTWNRWMVAGVRMYGQNQEQRRREVAPSVPQRRRIRETDEHGMDRRGDNTNQDLVACPRRTSDGVDKPRRLSVNTENSNLTSRERKSVLITPDSLQEDDNKSEVMKLKNELAREIEAKQCVVCLDNPRMIMVKPCNHYCLCRQCWKKLTKCPMCTRRIVRVETIYNV